LADDDDADILELRQPERGEHVVLGVDGLSRVLAVAENRIDLLHVWLFELAS